MSLYCADCCHMDDNRNREYKFKCTNSRSGYDTVAANMIACQFFGECLSSRRSTSEKDRLFNISKYKRDYYIVTAICKILKLGTDNKYMYNFKYVRDVILPRLYGGNEWLKEYDEFGPLIAEQLENEENAVEFATLLKDEYLDTFVDLMEESNIDEAITVYQNMFSDLKIKYGYEPIPKKITLYVL